MANERVYQALADIFLKWVGSKPFFSNIKQGGLLSDFLHDAAIEFFTHHQTKGIKNPEYKRFNKLAIRTFERIYARWRKDFQGIRRERSIEDENVRYAVDKNREKSF